MFKYFIIALFIIAAPVVILLWADRRWYKRHPDAEEKLAKMDEKLMNENR